MRAATLLADPSLFDPDRRTVMAFGPVAVQAVPTTYVGRTSYEPLREGIELVRTGAVTVQPSRRPSTSGMLPT